MDLRISVVICTLDRAAYLRKALASLAAQTLPTAAFEILVVDNGSRDDTAAVVAAAPGVRYLKEPVLGLSRARNRGWQEARAPYVAFLDDDAKADPGWLAALCQAFETVTPQPGCVGGRVDPLWEAPRPDWLGAGLLPYLSVLDRSPTARLLEEGEWLVGVNMAFPREVLAAVGGFDVRLGRTGQSLISLEEVALLRRVRRLGLSWYYEPAARVGHHIPAARLRKRWFLRRVYSEGISIALADALPHDAEPARGETPAPAASGALKDQLARRAQTILRLLRAPGRVAALLRPHRFETQCLFAGGAGYLIGAVQARRLSSSP